MTWKRIKRKSLARLRRISSNLDSGPGGESTKQTANHSASLSVSRPLWDQTGVTFPAVCRWGLFLSPKRILGIGADNVTILHLQTNIWGSDTSQVQSNHRNLHAGVNINWRSSDRKWGRERETWYRDRLRCFSWVSSCTCCCLLLWLEQLEISPAEISAQADERITCSVTSARKINGAACRCSLEKIHLRDSCHYNWWGGRGVGGAAIKPNCFFHPKAQVKWRGKMAFTAKSEN